MSGNHNQPDQDDPDGELESLLKRLQPRPLDVDQLDRLGRESERITTSQANPSGRIQWKRVMPLATACLLMMCAVALYQFGFRLTRGTPEKSPPPTLTSPLAQSDPSSVTPAMPADASDQNLLSDRFVPISSRGYLINSSSKGVVDTEEGPREKLQLQFEDTHHWYDPNTGTNIRFFTPHNEEMIIPLPSH
jgi:hypothetical protein